MCMQSSYENVDVGLFGSMNLTSKLDTTAFTKVCDSVRSKTFPCIDSFIESISMCMSEKEKRQITVVIEALRGAITYVCSKKSEDFEAIKASKSDECLNSKDKKVKQCLIDHFMDYKNRNESQVFETLTMMTSEDKCVDLVGFESCIRKVFDECDNKRPMELFSGLFESFIAATPCSTMKTIDHNHLD